jgi:hypothetical protein
MAIACLVSVFTVGYTAGVVDTTETLLNATFATRNQKIIYIAFIEKECDSQISWFIICCEACA